MPRADLIDDARMGSHTARVTVDFLDGFERLSSKSDCRYSFRIPKATVFPWLNADSLYVCVPSEISFAFSSACAAFLNGEKLMSETILPNFARSSIESWTALVKAPTFSWSFTSNIAYPDADSKRA